MMASLLSVAAQAENAAEQKIKTEIQRQVGDRAKVSAVRPTPIKGLYEVSLGNDVVYTDVNAQYLVQGEIVDLKSGANLTEQRINELNKINWADLPLADAIKVVKGNGSRQLAVFADPHCGYCKRLEKTFQEMNNVTIYTFLIPMLSADSKTTSLKIWCSADKGKLGRTGCLMPNNHKKKLIVLRL